MKSTPQALGALASMLLLLYGSARATHAAELWVAPNGDDANPGTKESPLASPAMALRKARDLRRTNSPAVQDGIHIVLKGGIYPLTAPLIVRPEDSGTATSLTIIEAAPGGQPVLSGGAAITNWRKLEANVPGLPDAKGNVWVADAPRANGRVLEFRQLWVKDQKAVRARTPNGQTCERLTAWDPKTQSVAFPAALVAALQARPAGAGLSRIELVQQQQWEIAFLRIKSFVTPPVSLASATSAPSVPQVGLSFQQPESRMEFEHPWPQPILPSKGGGGAFFLANAIEFLDEPGEWYEEMPGGLIYYWPRAGEDMTKDTAIAPALETLVQVTGNLDKSVSYVTFKGIGFAHSAWMRPSLAGHVPLQAGMALEESYKLRPAGTPDAPGLDNQDWIIRMPAAVTVNGAHDIRFERCCVEHTAASALDFISGTHNDVIEGNLFRDIGGNAIQMASFQEGAGGGTETHIPYNPKDEREICTRERIANNLVTDAANEDWGCVGICVGYGRQITIEHNEVSNVSYTGISLGWGWTKMPNAMRDNRIHANLLDHVATRMCDTAGIYTLSAQPGTTITENCIDNIKMSPYVDRPDHWFYLYTDEGSSNITLRDNWCPAEKFLKNANGPGNVWENNGPLVSDQIKNAAGLEADFQDILKYRTTPAK